MIDPALLRKLDQLKDIETIENDKELVRAMCMVAMYYHIDPDKIISMPIDRFQILHTELINEINRREKFLADLFKGYFGGK